MLQEEVYKHMKKQFIGYRNFSYQKHFLLTDKRVRRCCYIIEQFLKGNTKT